MDTICQLLRDIERYEDDAHYYTERAEHCRSEAALLRQEFAQEQARERLNEAHVLAAAILELGGLTGVESEATERVMCSQSCCAADIARLRAIALNHSIFRTDVL